MTTDIPAADVSPVTPAGALVLEPPILRAPPAIRAWPALAATASVAGIALVVAAAHEAALPASSPIDAPGRWGVALAGGVALAFAGYVCGIVSLRRRAVPVAAVIAVAAAVQLAPLAGPTLLSTDTWTYWMYGRVGAVEGGNPYGDPPSTYPGDVAYPAMGSSWRDTTSLYGPLFTIGSELHAHVAGEDPVRAAWLFRLVAALAVLGTAVLAASFAVRPAFAAAFVGWNPLLALHFGGGGHNDAVMMLLVVGALALAARGRPNLAGIAWIGAIGLKWVAIAFLAVWAVDRVRRREPLGLVGLAAGGVALVARRHRALRNDVGRGIRRPLEPGATDRFDRAVEVARRSGPRTPGGPRGDRPRNPGSVRVARTRGVARASAARGLGLGRRARPGLAQPVVRELGRLALRERGGLAGLGAGRRLTAFLLLDVVPR